jgi:outer membrane lipoprotein LolB
MTTRFLVAGLAVLLLSACSTRETREQGAWLAERAAWLEAHPNWSVSGRLGLSDGERGGSLAFDWDAEGNRHVVRLRTLAGGQQWRLEFDPEQATLSGSDVDTMRGRDPDELVRRATGWPIPVAWMTRWLLGMPAPQGAELRFAPDGTLAELSIGDWGLDFRRFSVPPGYTVLMPSRIEARRSPYRIRAALTGWSFDRTESAAFGRVAGDESL